MSRQNRVTPFGQIVAIPARGTLMGNRGCLHDTSGNVTKLSARTAWVTCRLQWKGIHRSVMAPGKYTELFFLDEATALAAGHRPCNDCRSERLREFQRCWSLGVEGSSGGNTPVSRIDPVMHADRLMDRKVQRTYAADLDALPDGVFIALAGQPQQAWLWWNCRLRPWSPSGYGLAPVQYKGAVTVLTPRSTVATLAAGYKPEVHLTVL